MNIFGWQSNKIRGFCQKYLNISAFQMEFGQSILAHSMSAGAILRWRRVDKDALVHSDSLVEVLLAQSDLRQLANSRRARSTHTYTPVSTLAFSSAS